MDDVNTLLKRMETSHPRYIDLSLERVLRLLDALGQPHTKLPPVVHVAGTNGKGSTIAFLRAILEAAGYRVHVYTSPHLIRFHERIVVAGDIISDDALAPLLSQVLAVREDVPATYFEATTVAAFLAFAQTPADAVLLETGLGGRLDATNVIDTPLLTVITPIGMDHQEYLGNTIASIAGEKAGIIKRGVQCVSAPQAPEALKVLQERARALNAPLISGDVDWRYTAQEEGFRVTWQGKTTSLPAPALPGSHQLMNAATAWVASRCMANVLPIPQAAVAEGIRKARWPARLQPLARAEWLEGLPEGSEVWLDGGHNPHAARMLADFLRSRPSPCQRVLICAMTANRDPESFLSPFRGVADRLIALPMPEEHAGCPATELAAKASAMDIPAIACKNLEESMEYIKVTAASVPCKALICGSLYLAGDVLKAYYKYK